MSLLLKGLLCSWEVIFTCQMRHESSFRVRINGDFFSQIKYIDSWLIWTFIVVLFSKEHVVLIIASNNKVYFYALVLIFCLNDKNLSYNLRMMIFSRVNGKRFFSYPMCNFDLRITIDENLTIKNTKKNSVPHLVRCITLLKTNLSLKFKANLTPHKTKIVFPAFASKGRLFTILE